MIVGVTEGEGRGPAPRWDFFISYTQADRPWAEWVAWQLEEAGYRVLIQVWDFVPGSNWMSEMERGIAHSGKMISLLSPAYLKSVYGGQEWQAALAADPDGFRRKLLPVRIERCDPPVLLRTVVGFDLFDRDQEAARRYLLEQVQSSLRGRAKPLAAPAFPVPRQAVAPARKPQFPPDEGPRRSDGPSRPDDKPPPRPDHPSAGRRSRARRYRRRPATVGPGTDTSPVDGDAPEKPATPGHSGSNKTLDPPPSEPSDLQPTPGRDDGIARAGRRHDAAGRLSVAALTITPAMFAIVWLSSFSGTVLRMSDPFRQPWGVPQEVARAMVWEASKYQVRITPPILAASLLICVFTYRTPVNLLAFPIPVAAALGSWLLALLHNPEGREDRLETMPQAGFPLGFTTKINSLWCGDGLHGYVVLYSIGSFLLALCAALAIIYLVYQDS